MKTWLIESFWLLVFSCFVLSSFCFGFFVLITYSLEFRLTVSSVLMLNMQSIEYYSLCREYYRIGSTRNPEMVKDSEKKVEETLTCWLIIVTSSPSLPPLPNPSYMTVGRVDGRWVYAVYHTALSTSSWLTMKFDSLDT